MVNKIDFLLDQKQEAPYNRKTWRCTQVVVRGRTRNAIGPSWARGFDSHHLRWMAVWRKLYCLFCCEKILANKKVPVHFHVPAKRGREKKNLYKKLTCLLGEGRQPQSWFRSNLTFVKLKLRCSRCLLHLIMLVYPKNMIELCPYHKPFLKFLNRVWKK